MSDLSALFPDLPPEILRDFDSTQYPSGGPLSVEGEQSSVTDDQIASYLQQIGSLRAPLRPAVSGQTPPSQPQFTAGRGRQAPDPNASYTEAPDVGDGSQPLPPASEPSPTPAAPIPTQPLTQPTQPPRATETTPLPPPPSPPTPSTPSDIPPPPDLWYQPPQQPEAVQTPPIPVQIPQPQADQPPTSRQAALESLAQLWESDPQLRTIVAQYLTTGQTPAAAQPSSAAPPTPPVPGVPPPSPYYPPQPSYPPTPSPPPAAQSPQFDEFTDPHIRALYDQNAAIQRRLDSLAQSQTLNDERIQQSQLHHYESIVEAVCSKFGSDYALPPSVLQSVRETAARLGAANSYMNGIHPVTGLPVRPDPAEATRTALHVAYYTTPSARDLESQRTIQRAQHDAQHRQRLSGVGGSSASVPRTPPQPTNPQDRNAAMIGEVREMFNGSWTGGNTN